MSNYNINPSDFNFFEELKKHTLGESNAFNEYVRINGEDGRRLCIALCCYYDISRIFEILHHRNIESVHLNQLLENIDLTNDPFVSYKEVFPILATVTDSELTTIINGLTPDPNIQAMVFIAIKENNVEDFKRYIETYSLEIGRFGKILGAYKQRLLQNEKCDDILKTFMEMSRMPSKSDVSTLETTSNRIGEIIDSVKITNKTLDERTKYLIAEDSSAIIKEKCSIVIRLVNLNLRMMRGIPFRKPLDKVIENLALFPSYKLFCGFQDDFPLQHEHDEAVNYLNTATKLLLEHRKENMPSLSQSQNTTLKAENDDNSLEFWYNRFDRFVDECLILKRGIENEFIQRYRRNLIELIKVTDTGTGLYALAMLFFPIMPKAGRRKANFNPSDSIKPLNGISWNTNRPTPNNQAEVVKILQGYFANLKKCPPLPEKSLEPSRLIGYLAKQTINGQGWIQDFIGDYWSPEMMKEFERKLNK